MAGAVAVDEELGEEVTRPDWNGWKREGGRFVHSDEPHRWYWDWSRLVTAADLVDTLAVLKRDGASDRCIAGLARAFIDLRRRK
jgi:hypothetical protein